MYNFSFFRDLIIIGANGRELSVSLAGHKNSHLFEDTLQTYRFRVNADSGWKPHYREIDFIGILSNISEIKVRATYSRGGWFFEKVKFFIKLCCILDIGYLHKFSMGSVKKGLKPEEGIPTPHADWVETCKCGEGYMGQFCESCVSGYRRAFKFGGSLAKCIKCDCHGHSDVCDPESGKFL